MRPISDEQRAAILESLGAGVALDAACRAVRVAPSDARELARLDPAWATALAGATSAAPSFADLAAHSAALDVKTVAPPKAPRDARPIDPEIGDSSGTVPTLCHEDGSPDWERIRIEAERDFGPGPFGLLMWQEERLAARGFPRMHQWWADDLENFYASHKRWHLVLAGRGMGKSSVLTRVAAVETAFTERRIPPGQTWIWPFVSVRPADAKRRLQEIKEIYGLGYHYALGNIKSPEGTPTLAMDDARGQSVAFVSFASTLGNVSGPNGLGATVDEEEKIERDTSEIIGSLIAMFRARAGIRGIRCSSAMTTRGSLHRSIREGDTISNYVAKIGRRFLPDTLSGFAAVAEWEEGRGNGGAATAIRQYMATLNADSPAIPSWTGNLMDSPDAASRAIALRVEAEGLPPQDDMGDLPRWRYFLREWGSWATGEDGLGAEDDFELSVIESRYGGEYAADRGY